MKVIALTALMFAVGGCASQGDSPEPESASASTLMSAPDREEPIVVCTREKPTGSNRLKKVCRPVADEVDREATRRDMRILQRQSEIINAPPD